MLVKDVASNRQLWRLNMEGRLAITDEPHEDNVITKFMAMDAITEIDASAGRDSASRHVPANRGNATIPE